MTDESLILSRIANARRDLDAWKRKVYGLRKLVAGDFEAILRTAGSEQEEGEANERRLDDFYDFIVRTYPTGHSNLLLRAVKILVMQIAFAFPEVEFEDLESELSIVGQQYLKRRLGRHPIGCSADKQMRRSLLDYVIGGTGWSCSQLKDGKPNLHAVDSLDMLWNRDAQPMEALEWAACEYRLPVREWERYGVNIAYEGSPERIEAVRWYYDTSGDEGTFAAIWNEEVVLRKPNPYRLEIDGEDRPMQPFTVSYFMSLPSVAAPMGVLEGMLGHQIAIWRGEQRVRQVIDRMKPFYWLGEETQFATKEDEERFFRGDIGAAVKGKGAPPQIVQGAETTRTELEQLEYHQREITGQAGVNPYKTGIAQDVNYAREVDEISGNADLYAAAIGNDYAEFWLAGIRKALAIGKMYDDSPLTVKMGEDVLEFGPSQPIGEFLFPDADIVIREGSLAFKPRRQAIEEAALQLETAVKLSDRFPGGVVAAYEKLLREQGERNLAPYLESAPETDDLTEEQMASTAV